MTVASGSVALSRALLRGRAVAIVGPSGLPEGEDEQGLYVDGVRVVRRIEVHTVDSTVNVPGVVELDERGAVARVELGLLAEGTGALLLVEFDGVDALAAGAVDGIVDAIEAGSGTRSTATVQFVAECPELELVQRDGVALAPSPVRVDDTPRTASWTWNAPTGGSAGSAVLELRLAWVAQGDADPGPPLEYAELAAAAASAGAWRAALPVLVAPTPEVQGVIEGSLETLAGLRLESDAGAVLGAGAPWSTTLTARDALIAAWMSLPVDPELARATVRHLAGVQAMAYDPEVDAEPGKILHEERRGSIATRWHERYYGSVDATPLFVLVVEQLRVWTADPAVGRELRGAVTAATDWIVARLEEDEYGLLATHRRAELGIDAQWWKRSADAMRDRTGRVSSGVLRPIESQGYAIAALRAAASMAELDWEDSTTADGWRSVADELQHRLLDRFESAVSVSEQVEDDPRADGFLALAVDSAGMAVDSLTSNVGHLLWVDALRGQQVWERRIARQLLHPSMASGWGIRTMSLLDSGYAADSPHCGAVWMHDTAICVAGVARVDPASADRLGRALFDVGAAAAGMLPTAVVGNARAGRTTVDPVDDPNTSPVQLPGAAAPSAWSAAAPFLVLRVLLGLEPSVDGRSLLARGDAAPSWLRGLRWSGVQAVGSRWDIAVADDGTVAVTRA